MTGGTQVIEAPTGESRRWLCESLEQGFDVSAAVLDAGLSDRGRFLAIVSDEFQRTEFDYETGNVISQRVAREKLGELLDEPQFMPAKAVLVEDSTARRGDPKVSHKGEPSGYLGNRVLHWADLSSGSGAAVEVISWGTSRYPTNAFFVSKSSTDLGLVDGQDLPENLTEEVVSSLTAVVVAAFDGESFLIWVRD